MALSNFERMIALAEKSFDARNDPHQLDVNEKVIEQLHRIHPSTVSEYATDEGPAAWILLIPTTDKLMHDFVDAAINEKQLFELTPLNVPYASIYLCSAMVLPEFRNKGIAKKLTLDAIENIRKTHTINSLFVWPFSEEGLNLSVKIAAAAGLPLFYRKEEK